jgi:hypothetical protein
MADNVDKMSEGQEGMRTMRMGGSRMQDVMSGDTEMLRDLDGSAR